MTRPQEFAKRTFDVLVSLIALVVFSPLFVLIAIAIRLDSRGSVLFLQQRLGRRSTPFTLYKFRTMLLNAADLRNADGSTFNSPDDARVTRMGTFLRSTSLDELPQLVNILAGQMSLVGPRPDLVDQEQFYSGDEWRRNLVKPGITGLAQIHGRNAICWAARKRVDVEYVSRQSLLLDMKILWRTIPYVVLHRNIHIQVSAQVAENVSEPRSESISEYAG